MFKKEWKTNTIIAIIMGLWMMGVAYGNTNDKMGNFCDGWYDGWEAGLEDCLAPSFATICPVEPVNSNGYKTGFGMGYAKAQRKHCN